MSRTTFTHSFTIFLLLWSTIAHSQFIHTAFLFHYLYTRKCDSLKKIFVFITSLCMVFRNVPPTLNSTHLQRYCTKCRVQILWKSWCGVHYRVINIDKVSMFDVQVSLQTIYRIDIYIVHTNIRSILSWLALQIHFNAIPTMTDETKKYCKRVLWTLLSDYYIDCGS